jgi:hypothetical protein
MLESQEVVDRRILIASAVSTDLAKSYRRKAAEETDSERP